jgi:hypothetical protein
MKPAILRLSLLSVLSVLSFALGGDRQIVTKDIIVGVGDTLFITPGSDYLFNGYTGIIIKGHLRAIGTKTESIAFASVADTTGGGSGFDWNGIEITASGSAEFAYCLIANATSGITADKANNLILDNCIFKNNGQWHLSVGGEIQPVKDGQPYTAMPATPAIPTPAELAATTPPPTAIVGAGSARPPRDTRRTWKRVLISAGAAFAATGTAELIHAHYIQQDYNAYAPGNAAFDAATPEARQRHYDRLRSAHGTAQAAGWALIGLAAADLLYLMFLF